jgi:thiol-disulfide isomerase/thioredoxin
MLTETVDLLSRERVKSTLNKTSARSGKAENEWPKPNSYVGRIPVYKKFADLEPIFHFDNDTIYVINFWATWCKPCIEELPYLEAFNSKYKDEKVKVILCSLDFPSKIESKLVPFVENRKINSKVIVLLDGKFNDWIDKVSADWSGAIPVTYIYSKNKSHFVSESFKSLKELEDAVEPLM